ncbi:MAG: Abi family protein [Bacteroidales bacterium]|nr:Abi family protein [Bacteroidales bacterium]
MKYEEYETALSVPRIGKYRLACKNDKNKALILYRYNIKLCQKFYGVLGVLEVVLRNAINEHFKTQLHDNNWLITQAQSGFLVNYQEAIFKERDKLVNNRKYTHDKLVASLSLGVWTFMFSRNCYKNSGKTLLQIFPNKTHGLNQRDIYADLDKVRSLRNRIAHHEPLCFDSTGAVSVAYVQEIFSLIVKHIHFLGYTTNELLYGVENPLQTINKIDELSKTLPVEIN